LQLFLPSFAFPLGPWEERSQCVHSHMCALGMCTTMWVHVRISLRYWGRGQFPLEDSNSLLTLGPMLIEPGIEHRARREEHLSSETSFAQLHDTSLLSSWTQS
jgi:hypothetical protein